MISATLKSWEWAWGQGHCVICIHAGKGMVYCLFLVHCLSQMIALEQIMGTDVHGHLIQH